MSIANDFVLSPVTMGNIDKTITDAAISYASGFGTFLAIFDYGLVSAVFSRAFLYPLSATPWKGYSSIAACFIELAKQLNGNLKKKSSSIKMKFIVRRMKQTVAEKGASLTEEQMKFIAQLETILSK